MIQWVEDRLNEWGLYMSGCRRGGSSGWPYVKCHIRSTAPAGVMLNPGAMEIDEILSKLKIERPKWYATAENLYRYGLSATSTAARMKCHIDTVCDRRDALHKHIEKQITARFA